MRKLNQNLKIHADVIFVTPTINGLLKTKKAIQPYSMSQELRASKKSIDTGQLAQFAYAYTCLNPLPDDKTLDWSKLKQLADDILKCT